MTYIYAGIKPSDSTLVTKALLAKRLGQTQFEHQGQDIGVRSPQVKSAVKAVLKVIRRS